MLNNYFKVAIRNLLRHKGYSALNIVGLAVGMACCILVLLYVQNEFQYDAFHKDGDRIYRVVSKTENQDGSTLVRAGTSGALAPAMEDAFAEVEATMRVWMSFNGAWFRVKNQVSMEKLCVVDPEVFEFFSFTLLKGDSRTALREPFTAVISESMARKYFKYENPIGQVVQVESRVFGGDYRVTGVMQDLPEHSSIKMDFATSTTRSWESNWVWHTWYESASYRPLTTFVRLKAGVSPESLAEKLPDLVRRKYHEKPETSKLIQNEGFDMTYYLQPLNRVWLYSKSDYGIDNAGYASATSLELYGDIERVYLLSAIAVFVLVIACINFMNLTTARSVGRAREVGLRKVVGAHRSGLIQQFLGESVFMALLSLVLAVGVVILALPAFNGFLGKSLSLWASGHVFWFVVLLGLAVFVGLLAGSYPAFYLSVFEPADVVKGTFKSSGQGAFLRKGLVILQFAMSILLMVGTAVVYRQLDYMQNKELGFKKDQVVMLRIFHLDTQAGTNWQDRLVRRYQTIKQAFLAHPNVEDATVARFVMGRSGGHARLKQPEGLQSSIRLYQQPVDENFIDFFGLELVAGRNFLPEEMFRGGKYIVNEAAVKAFGWSEPLGKKITGDRPGISGVVVGVVKDFHYGSQHEKIRPAALIPVHHLIGYVVLRVQPENFSETVDFMKKTWNQFLPQRPFEFTFLDESLNNLYETEQRVGKATGVFALVAIGLACLGLFGLAAFTAEQRTKEIGIRKTMGASVGQIVLLLSMEFTKWVLLANVIAWPVAYYTLNAWLQGFAYRTTLGLDVFFISGSLAVLIAFLTVGVLAVRAAQTNPVDALRNE